MELDNVQRWAEQNNLNLNCSKSTEIVLRDSRRRHTAAEPPPLPGIAHSNCMKRLGVSIGNDLTVSQHVQRLVMSSAQASYALRVLRTRGLDDATLQHVYRATVVARLTYAASAWRGLARTSDLQRISSVIDRARRHGYCPADLPSYDEQCDDADDDLFSKAVRCSNHVLHPLLPPPSTASQNYNLRHRTHSLQLPGHATHLMDCTFITRMLYKDAYYHHHHHHEVF